MQSVRRLVILRGLPGSGKSYLARQLLTEECCAAQNGAVLSTDDFFLNPSTGNYEWNMNGLPKAHLWNQLRARRMMEQGASPLIIDNTNLQAWEAGPYVRAADEFGYSIELKDPDTAWANDPAECAKRGAHGLREDAIARLLGKREEYSVKDARRAAEREEPTLDDKERKKVELMIANLFAKKAGGPTTSATDTTGALKPASTVRVEIAKNDGRKERPKPLVLKSNGTLTDVARLAANALKLRIGPNGARFFTIRGEELHSVADFTTGMQIVISDNGQNYVPIALRKTAAQRRAERAERALAEAGAEDDSDDDDEEEEEGEKNTKKEREAAKAAQGALRRMGKLLLGASEVSPRLFIGSGRDAHTLSELQRCRISHVLNCANDFPSSRISSIAAMRQLQLSDTEDAQLAPHLPLALEFIDSALQQAEARVLVHCAAGKSRSVAIVLCYLISRHRMTLRDALAQVRAARPVAAPNAGFIRQLLALERRELKASSIGWEELASAETVLGWLQKYDLGGAAQRATHMWCEPNCKHRFRIPPQRREELLGEVARAVSLDPPQALALIEFPDPVKSRMHADVDVMFDTEQPQLSLVSLASVFVTALSLALAKEFPALPPQAFEASITGCSSAHAMASRENVKWKAGLHVTWRGIIVTQPQQLALLRAFITHLGAMEVEKKFPVNFPVAAIRACNEWSEVIDLEQPETGLRMLYSGKKDGCKSCAHKTAGKRAKEQKPLTNCPYCHGAGILPDRRHVFLGVYAADGTVIQRELAAETTMLGKMQRLQLTSIGVPSFEDDEPTPAASGPATSVHYTAAVLDLLDQARLLAAFTSPPGWTPFATHVTLCLGPHSSKIGYALGDCVTLTVTAIGKSESAWAVRVSAPKMQCLHSTVPHITLYVAPGALPADANFIKEWKETLPAELTATPLLATVQHCTGSLRNNNNSTAAASSSAPATSAAPILTRVTFTPSPTLSAQSLTRLLPKQAPKDRVLPLITHLRAHGEASLTSGGQIKAARHALHRHLVQLSYGQASADFSDPVVRDCRGIIVDSKDNYRIVALPYSKFFNAGEVRAAELDWRTTRVYEKADGSLALLYHYAGEWHVASSSSPDGSGMVLRTHHFAALFWEIWRSSGYSLPGNTQLTYMFELLSPRFYPLIAPKREALLLHGTRDRETLEEFIPEEVASVYGWECVPMFAFASLDALRTTARRLDVTQQEGFVAVDANCQRVKVKSPSYVALSLLRGVTGGGRTGAAVGTSHMLEIVRNNEGGEFLASFPEYSALHTSVSTKYEALLERIQKSASNAGDGSEEDSDDEEDDTSDAKEEAKLAAEFVASGSANLRTFLSGVELDRLHRLLGLGTASARVAAHEKKGKEEKQEDRRGNSAGGARGKKADKQQRQKNRRGKQWDMDP